MRKVSMDAGGPLVLREIVSSPERRDQKNISIREKRGAHAGSIEVRAFGLNYSPEEKPKSDASADERRQTRYQDALDGDAGGPESTVEGKRER